MQFPPIQQKHSLSSIENFWFTNSRFHYVFQFSAQGEVSRKIEFEWKTLHLKHNWYRVKTWLIKVAECTHLSLLHLWMILRDLSGHIEDKHHSFCEHIRFQTHCKFDRSRGSASPSNWPSGRRCSFSRLLGTALLKRDLLDTDSGQNFGTIDSQGSKEIIRTETISSAGETPSNHEDNCGSVKWMQRATYF
jgi:hypothetical protein